MQTLRVLLGFALSDAVSKFVHTVEEFAAVDVGMGRLTMRNSGGGSM